MRVDNRQGHINSPVGYEYPDRRQKTDLQIIESRFKNTPSLPYIPSCLEREKEGAAPLPFEDRTEKDSVPDHDVLDDHFFKIIQCSLFVYKNK
jgi:hypothetical protein